MWKRISFVTAREKSTVTNEMASPRKDHRFLTLFQPATIHGIMDLVLAVERERT